MHLIQVPQKIEYEDTDWTRKKDGVILSDMHAQDYRRLYEGKPFSHFGGARLSHDHCSFVLPEGKRLLFTTVRRMLGEYDTVTRIMHAYSLIPNGQVKNFLVACRTVSGLIGKIEKIRVAVVGSKAMEGGGLWHKYFALWLLQYFKVALVDFFDMAEMEKDWSYEKEGREAHLSWYAEKIDPQELSSSSYEVIIDDVWTFETGSGLFSKSQLVGKCFSLKGVETQDGFVPFLHVKETRFFSHQGQDLKVACQCLICSSCASCSQTYDQFLTLRGLVCRLGHSSHCLDIPFVSEQNVLDSVHRTLESRGYVDVTSLSMLRSIIALSEEVGLVVDREKIRKKGDPWFLPLNRKNRKIEIQKAPEYEWLRRKRIMFCGVSPEIIGSTEVQNIKPGASAGSEIVDFTFVNSCETWMQRSSSGAVYCDERKKKVLSLFPGWICTGRLVGRFREYASCVDTTVSLRTTKTPLLGQITKSGIASSPFFPYLCHQGVLLNYRKKCKSKTFEVFTPKYFQGRVELERFDPQKWRSSVLVSGQEYSLLKNNMEVFPKVADHLGGFNFVPWGITKKEYEMIEVDREVYEYHNELKRIFSDKVQFGDYLRSRRLNGYIQTLGQYYSKQEEFVQNSETGLLQHHSRSVPFGSKYWTQIYETCLLENRSYDYYMELRRVAHFSTL